MILSRDAATMMDWSGDWEDADFTDLTKSYQDQNAKFDNKGYWTYDACAVQFNGES